MKKLLSLVLSMILLLSSIPVICVSAAEAKIPRKAVEFNGHSYYVYSISTVTTWEDAKDYCENLGGHLAVISSYEENTFLSGLNGTSNAFFGYSDVETEGTWKWVADEGSSFTNWNSGEPNNQGDEDFAQFYSSDGKWNDNQFSTGNAFVCEWDEKKPTDSFVKIYTVDDLFAIQNNLDDSYILMNDIDLSEIAQTSESNDLFNHAIIGSPFTGEFDGNGHTIKAWTINTTESGVKNSNIGLFSMNKGTIKNLNFENISAEVYLGQSSNFGTVCGINNGLIENCAVKGVFSITSFEKFENSAGLVVGLNNGTVKHCRAYGEASFSIHYFGNYSFGGDDAHFGGIIGSVSEKGIASCCSNYSNIDGTIQYYQSMYIGIKIGGVCGALYGTLENSFNKGNITVEQKSIGNDYATFPYVGGVIGAAEDGGTAHDCYNCGNITGTSVGSRNIFYLGGVIGIFIGNANNLFNIGQISLNGTNYSFAGYIGGAGDICGSNCENKTINSAYYIGAKGSGYGKECKKVSIEEMKIRSTFSGFDFENTWIISVEDKDEYPHLRQNPEKPFHIHLYVYEVTAPTCTEQGYTTYTCSKCHDSYTADYVPANGHTEGEWKVTKQPTFTSKGIKTLYCSVCGKVIRTESIPKLTQGRVNSVKIDDVSLNYKSSTTLKPSIQVDAGVKYTVKYESSNTKVATVDQNGKVTAVKRGSGSATITCTVTDQYGNVVKDTCTVNVSLSFSQKIIVYVLFGWIWY